MPSCPAAAILQVFIDSAELRDSISKPGRCQLQISDVATAIAVFANLVVETAIRVVRVSSSSVCKQAETPPIWRLGLILQKMSCSALYLLFSLDFLGHIFSLGPRGKGGHLVVEGAKTFAYESKVIAYIHAIIDAWLNLHAKTSKYLPFTCFYSYICLIILTGFCQEMKQYACTLAFTCGYPTLL